MAARSALRCSLELQAPPTQTIVTAGHPEALQPLFHSSVGETQTGQRSSFPSVLDSKATHLQMEAEGSWEVFAEGLCQSAKHPPRHWGQSSKQ